MIQLLQGDNDLRRALTWNEGKGQQIRSNFNDPAKKLIIYFSYYLRTLRKSALLCLFLQSNQYQRQ